MHPTECVMSFVQTLHVINSSVCVCVRVCVRARVHVGGGVEGEIVSFRGLLVALSDDGSVVLNC